MLGLKRLNKPIVGLTLKCQLKEVPLLSPCPTPTTTTTTTPTITSKFFGGKFKHLNRKNSEFLAGKLNSKCKMQNAKCKMQIANMQRQNAF